MADIYIRDFSAYSDDAFLSDARAIVHAKIPEGPTLEYKSSISDSDRWLRNIAAFANAYGGLLLFGISESSGAPDELVGFEESSEVALKLVNQVVSCIQPRPDFQIKVASLPGNPTKLIAALRVREGWDTPYVYSRGDTHRVYVRIGPRVVEADHLQLLQIVEKRNAKAALEQRATGELARVRNVVVARSEGLLVSKTFYRFAAVLHSALPDVIDQQVETRFGNAVFECFPVDAEQITALRSVTSTGTVQWVRTPTDTTLSYFFHQEGSFERRWFIGNSSVAFATVAVHSLAEAKLFSLVDFVYDFVSFMRLVSLYFSGKGLYGSAELSVDLLLHPGVQLHNGGILYAEDCRFPNPSDWLNVSAELAGAGMANTRISVQPFAKDPPIGVLRTVLNQLARSYGGILRHDPEILLPELLNVPRRHQQIHR